MNDGRPTAGERDMTVQITFDCADPARLAEFWAAALGYVIQPPPDGFDSWDAALEAWGVPPDERDRASAVIDPGGRGPRLYFQKVPEAKQTKNRVHLDVNVGPDAIDARAAELVELGATRVDEREQHGERWVVMADPEGNEFCLQ
jgi:hypothetical protein